MKASISIIAVLCFLMCFSYHHLPQINFHHVVINPNDWVVPEAAKKAKNPIKSTSEAIKAGKSLYEVHCKSCHGGKGKGDGTKAKSLNSSCGDFSTANFQSQTDGALFYKIKEGREDMPSYKKKIPDESEIWSLVIYLRTLGAQVKQEEPKKTTTEEKKQSSTSETKNNTTKTEEKPVVPKKDSVAATKDSLMKTEKNKIALVLTTLETAINNTDTNAILKLYSTDAIYLAKSASDLYGNQNIKTYFKQKSKTNKLNLHYSITDIQFWQEGAIVTVSIKGENTSYQSKESTKEDSKGIFVFIKKDNDWKIYRAMD